jgi:hypothetical protein
MWNIIFKVGTTLGLLASTSAHMDTNSEQNHSENLSLEVLTQKYIFQYDRHPEPQTANKLFKNTELSS